MHINNNVEMEQSSLNLWNLFFHKSCIFLVVPLLVVVLLLQSSIVCLFARLLTRSLICWLTGLRDRRFNLCRLPQQHTQTQVAPKASSLPLSSFHLPHSHHYNLQICALTHVLNSQSIHLFSTHIHDKHEGLA